MKHLIYALVAVSFGMLVTSGAVMLATAAPTPAPVELEVEAHLDTLIARQLEGIKSRERL